MNSEKNSVDIEISSYYENLDKYFKLKREYEEKYEKAKNKYIKNPKLDKEEKRRKVKMIKKKCFINVFIIRSFTKKRPFL